MKPRITVLVPALLGYRSVVAALDAWEAQTCRKQLEVLVLVPTATGADDLPVGQKLVVTGHVSMHQARAMGIERASADFVMVAEDHCLPDPDWTEAILPRLEEGWDAVGCELRSGWPRSGPLQASFLLGYSQWMKVETGVTSILPGHNVIWRKSVLLELGKDLESELVLMAFLVQRMAREGKTMFIESEAKMRHFDPDGLGRGLRIFATVGLGFGAQRTKDWGLLKRLSYLLSAPVIGAMHWRRAALHYLRAGKESGLSRNCLLWSMPLAFAWGCGEAVGAMRGLPAVLPLLWKTEVKPVTRATVAASVRDSS